MPSPLRVHVALITVSVVFGANYVFTKQILSAVSPAAWVWFRIVAATAFLVPLAMLLRRTSGWPRARLWVGLGVASFFGVVLNQVLFTEGIARTTPEHSAVINAGIPTWTMLVAVCAGQERLGWRRVLAIALALCGVLYLLGFDQMVLGTASGSAPPADGPTLLGDLLTMANGIAFAVHLVLMRRLGRQVDPMTATAVMFVLASLMVGAWSAPQVTATDCSAVWSAPTVWLAAYAVLFATVMTYLLNTWALRHTHSSQVALYINVQPLVAAALNAALGAEPPGHRFFGALVLVAMGLWLLTRGPAP
ncbi:MAG TPA: DMT family transporter [Planctomycetota bacterium]|nr:DMT family transporter [Planctomycetota bacterium]